MTKLEQKLQKMARDKKILEKKVAIEKKDNRDKFLNLLGKAYIEKIKSSKINEPPIDAKEWRKEKIFKVSEFLPTREQEWIQQKLDEGLINLDIKP